MKKSAEIISVGTELLLGDIVDTNAAYASVRLAEIGINVYYRSTVGDNDARLREVFGRALERADIVITSGGLGPTYDDMTKETIASLLGTELVCHKPTLDKIKEYFEKRNICMTENNVKQALIPKGAEVLENERGTAPGIIFAKSDKTVIMLPGPPREFEWLFAQKVQPYLAERFSDGVIVSKNIRIFGMGESLVEDALKDVMTASSNPTLAPYAKDGEVLLRVTAKADNTQTCLALIEPMIEKVRERVGEYIYGIDVDSLQHALYLELKNKGKRIAFAESCTGGLTAKRMTEIPGVSEVFEGGVCTYSNELKMKLLGVKEETLIKYGAVSAETATQMAQGVLALTGADIAVSITGVAGPDASENKPVGTVWLAAAWDGKVCVKKLELARGKNEREYIRYLSSSNALAFALEILKKEGNV